MATVRFHQRWGRQKKVVSTNENYIVEEMPDIPNLGEFEQVVILAVFRLGAAAYGVTIREEIVVRTAREVSAGALYTTLERLEEKGLLTSRLGDATPVRGGRAKRYVAVTPEGLAAVAHAQRSYRKLLEGVRLPGFSHA